MVRDSKEDKIVTSVYIEKRITDHIKQNLQFKSLAEWINESGFYVGCHQGLDENDMARVSELIHDFYGR